MSPERPHGFAIVSAIFLLVVLAALGGFIVTIATSQHIGSALDVTGARAYQAARAGTEWGLYRALKASSCVASADIGVLDTIAVTVTCTPLVVAGDGKEAGSGSIYSIVATACNLPAGTSCPGLSGDPNYVERRLTAIAEN